MPRNLATVLLASILAAGALPAPAAAYETDCDRSKLTGLSHAVQSLMRCRVSTVAHAESPDPDCVAEVDSELAADFAAAETLDNCSSSGEITEVTSALHSFDDELMTLLVTAPEGYKCAAGKLRAMAKRAKREMACRRSASMRGTPYDPACTATAQSNLVEAFERRDAGGQCSTTGDADEAETLVANFLAYAAALIDGIETGAAPSDLAGVINGGDIDLVWTAPDPGSGLTQHKLLRRLNAAPTGPNDGSATLLFDGPGEAFTDDLTQLLPDTVASPRVYYYAVYGCNTGGNCETTGSHTSLSPTLVQALAAGGYVLHWRHAAADVCSDNLALGTADTTSVPDWWKSCDSNCATATARQLNNTGRADSAAIGDAFATRGIPVGRVVSSEFCRNVETAALMDFGPAIEEVPGITYYVYDESNRCAHSFEMFAVTPTAGTNTALIGHAGNACPPLSGLAWGEAAIYKPDGMGGSIYVDRVLPGGWLALP